MTATAVTAALLPLDQSTYRPHVLHSEERTWTETNCYVDVWIELLHAWGLDPIAVMAFTLRIDYEADQWTFFKVPLEDLHVVYGIEVGELNPWHELTEQIEHQLHAGRPVLVEVDAFYLPDTHGSSYRQAHVKTTVGVQFLDRAAYRVGYFHNRAYYEAFGADYLGLFPPPEARGDGVLPPYVEYVRLDRLERPEGAVLRDRVRTLMHRHWCARPAENPMTVYRRGFMADLAWLATQPMAMFHQYAFATLRQCGANFEIASALCLWLAERGDGDVRPAAEAFSAISDAAKTLQFTLARFAHNKRPFDAVPLLDSIESQWDAGMACVGRVYGG